MTKFAFGCGVTIDEREYVRKWNQRNWGLGIVTHLKVSGTRTRCGVGSPMSRSDGDEYKQDIKRKRKEMKCVWGRGRGWEREREREERDEKSLAEIHWHVI
jgi:hypothetical protein